MQYEENFLFSLRSVTVHLIKHVQPMHARLVPIVEISDQGGWPELSTSEKLEHVLSVESMLPELEAYYRDYPHGWSRERFMDLQKTLPLYRQELEPAQ
jgi:hypothetical protein